MLRLAEICSHFSAILEIQVEHVAGFSRQSSAVSAKKKKLMRDGGSTRVFVKPTRSVDKHTAATLKAPLLLKPACVSSLWVSFPRNERKSPSFTCIHACVCAKMRREKNSPLFCRTAYRSRSRVRWRLQHPWLPHSLASCCPVSSVLAGCYNSDVWNKHSKS